MKTRKDLPESRSLFPGALSRRTVIGEGLIDFPAVFDQVFRLRYNLLAA